jgi:hypothetical protein
VSELADEHEQEEHDPGEHEHADSEAHEHGEHAQGDHEHDHAADDAMLEDMLQTIREARVAPLILSTVSTFASVAYGKLEAKEFSEAKIAIDAIAALLPLLKGEVDEAILRDFEQALTNLRLGYADAVASAE